MSKKHNKDYEVGYGKPPKATQFKKGQSGNTKGRPKKSENVRTLLRETLNQQVQVRVNGRVKTIRLREAYVQKLTEKAMNGSMRDMLAFLKEVERIAPELLENETKPEPVVWEFVLPDGQRMTHDEFLARGPETEE
ncbi:DUF5681 domain-containing protein [Aliiroseovarius sp. S1339]|uniref:DUF5681 domain-containing protein n=1 Tax=Aliiroseovarius sp. S1339 TaxID=2936990 RepID=UPI0020BF2E7E|nr:DUF5681 domain-containing protein [Aliiroseovarius sp. S1339]MCK8465191.1 DUF5681 domain-containing protein [Aliiroseovarius sp. S1339]